MNVADKNHILSYSHKARPSLEESYTHVPKISKKSKELANEHYKRIKPLEESSKSLLPVTDEHNADNSRVLGPGSKPLNFYERQVYYELKK